MYWQILPLACFYFWLHFHFFSKYCDSLTFVVCKCLVESSSERCFFLVSLGHGDFFLHYIPSPKRDIFNGFRTVQKVNHSTHYLKATSSGRKNNAAYLLGSSRTTRSSSWRWSDRTRFSQVAFLLQREGCSSFFVVWAVGFTDSFAVRIFLNNLSTIEKEMTFHKFFF